MSPTSSPAPVVAVPTSWPTFPSITALDERFEVFVDRAQNVRGLSKSTLTWYRDGYGSFRRYLMTQARADGAVTILPGIIEEWAGWNRRRGISGFSVLTYWVSVKRFIRVISERDGFYNPFKHAEAPGRPEHKFKALKPQDCERVLLTVRNYGWRSSFETMRNTAMLAVALYAGLRRREILRLKRSNVDLKQGTIDIERGKGRHGGKDRTAYICGELATILRAYEHERNVRKIESPEYFVSLRTRGAVSTTVLRGVVEKVRDAAGIPFSLHALRHSFVTMLLRANVPIRVARDLAGHAHIKTTEEYGRVFREDLRRHVESVSFKSVSAVE